jgi:hypothetical protein
MVESADPANRLALAGINLANQAQGALETFDSTLAELNPSAEVIAQAICIATMRAPGFSATRDVLAARLQLMLTREHVAAQERMTSAATYLTVALVVLTAALLGLGAVDYWRH